MAYVFTLLGVEWIEREPFVLVRNGGRQLIEPVPANGFDLRFRVRADLRRVCLGHRRTAGGEVCERRVPDGQRTCQKCSIEAAMHASDLHHAHTRQPSGALKAHLDQPNLLYLAAFGDGSIKVGTSTEHRITTRLLEQGAVVARIVARTADGARVRVLEDVVTQTLGIAQTVGIERKLRGLIRPVETDRLVGRLDELGASVHETLAGLGEWDRVDDRWHNPVRWGRVFRYPADVAAGSHQLQATGAHGRVLRVTRPDVGEGADSFVVDAKRLYGLPLERGSFETPSLSAQHSLF